LVYILTYGSYLSDWLKRITQKSINQVTWHIRNIFASRVHPQRHFKVGEKLVSSYTNAKLAPLSQSTYSSHT